MGDSRICSLNKIKFVVRTLSLPVLKSKTVSSLPPLALLVHMQGFGFKTSNLKAGVMNNYRAIIRK